MKHAIFKKPRCAGAITLLFTALPRFAGVIKAQTLIAPSIVGERQKTPPTVRGLALTTGSVAPDFSLPDMNGKVRRLGELKGKKNVLLTFFPKCFTSNCTSQVSSLRDSYHQLQAKDVEVWAVSVDAAGGSKGQRAFAKELHLPFPLLPDTQRKICLLYGATQATNQLAARMSVFIDKTGTIRWIDKQINIKTHGADVLTRMHELGIDAPSSKKVKNTAPVPKHPSTPTIPTPRSAPRS